MSNDLLEKGINVQREMFGSALADDMLVKTSAFRMPFHLLMTEIAFGSIWTRPGLDRRSRSMITIAMLMAQGKSVELQSHIRGALANGVTRDEILEVIIHGMVYCGVPNGVGAIKAADEVLANIDAKESK